MPERSPNDRRASGGRAIENCRATGNYRTGRRLALLSPAVTQDADVIIAPARAVLQLARFALATDKELSDFLKSVEKRAWKRAVYAVRDEDAALDIVQDTMIRLSEKYSDRPAAELPLLFQRILSNATMDWFRRQKVRNAGRAQFLRVRSAPASDGDFDILETLEALGGPLAVGERGRVGFPGADLARRSRRRSRCCRPVNARRSSCVTGRNSMSPRPPPRWGVPKGVSRRTARAPCMPWPRP